jgi:hypothetical protein
MTCSTMTGLLAATGTAEDLLDDDPADGIAPARRCCREGKAPQKRTERGSSLSWLMVMVRR